MRVVRFSLSILVAVSGNAIAQKQDYVGWLIYQGEKQSPAIELPTERGPWRLVHHDGTLIAEMPQPPLKKGYSFNFGECRIDGLSRNDIIAMVRHSKAVEWSKDVAAVWVSDPKAKQFVARRGRGVECRNEGYGV
jgi:hypothetical protein